MDFLWDSRAISGETLLPVGEPPTARLLMPCEGGLQLTDTAGNTHYREGRDFRLLDDRVTIELLPDSAIPSLSTRQLYPEVSEEHGIYGHRGSGRHLLFSEQTLFPDQQARAAYRHAGWYLWRPPGVPGSLEHTHRLLDSRRALKLCVFGDSISAGGNSPRHVNIPPFTPAGDGLVAERLRQSSGAAVELVNESVGGKTSEWGLDEVERIARHHGDLVILAWGMNDASQRVDPETFRGRVAGQISAIRKTNPDAEFVLVAGMCGNPEWTGSSPDLYGPYRDELAGLCRAGIVLADVTSLWQSVMTRKRFTDLTGNGVNHPNDFGHRLYADVVLHAIVNR